MQSFNTASKLQAVYLSRRKQNHAQFVRPCLGLIDDPLTTQPRKKGALFPMQSKKRRQGKRVYLLCRQARTSRARSYCVGLFVLPSIRQELHNIVIRKPILHAVNRQQIATTRAGLFRMQSRRRRWRGLHPVNTALPSTTRRKHAATGTCSPVHAAPGRLCKFAQNRAVKALQNRPISTTRDALQELTAAISNDLAAFRLTPGSAA